MPFFFAAQITQVIASYHIRQLTPNAAPMVNLMLMIAPSTAVDGAAKTIPMYSSHALNKEVAGQSREVAIKRHIHKQPSKRRAQHLDAINSVDVLPLGKGECYIVYDRLFCRPKRIELVTNHGETIVTLADDRWVLGFRMVSLKELEGTWVFVVIPAVNAKHAERVRLVTVESSGIWIESQNITNSMFEALETQMSDRTLVIFIPWSGVTTIISTIDKVSISETALRL